MNTYQSQSIPAEQRTAAVLAHLSAPIAMIVSGGWLSFVGPLLVWFVYRDRSPFVRRAAAGSFNFNLWAWMLSVVAWICAFTVILFPVALVLWAVAAIMTLYCHIKAAVWASDGRSYTYRHQIRLLS